MQNTHPHSFLPKRIFALAVLAFLGLFLFPSCSMFRGGDTSQIINPEGGTIEFAGGIQMIVPQNAVKQETIIHLIQIDNAEIVDILEDALIPIEPLVFFQVSLEEGELQNAVNMILPVSINDKFIGIPVHIEIDLENREMKYPSSEIVYDSDTGTIEFSLDSFSTHGVGTLPEGETHSDCDTATTACRCGWIRSESSAHDFSMGDCQALSYETITQFMNCPGQPTEKRKDSEKTAECDWRGTISFQYEILAEGMEWHINCSDPIPFLIGEDDKLSGGGKTHCTLRETFEGGAHLDLDYDSIISLSGNFDGFELKFDPYIEKVVNGHLKAWATVNGSEVSLIDVKFDDKQASADLFVYPEITLLSFVVPVESEEIDRSDFAFTLPLDDGAVNETTIPGDEALITMTVSLDLDIE